MYFSASRRLLTRMRRLQLVVQFCVGVGVHGASFGGFVHDACWVAFWGC